MTLVVGLEALIHSKKFHKSSQVWLLEKGDVKACGVLIENVRETSGGV